MKISLALFWLPTLVFCSLVLILVGCSRHNPTEFCPVAEHHEETLDLASDEESETAVSLPSLPYAPPPDLTGSDTK